MRRFFYVIDLPWRYNAILGKMCQHKMKAITSTTYQVLKFLGAGEKSIMELRGEKIESS